MRGINRVVVSGNVGGEVLFDRTGSGQAACSFALASDRHTDGSVVTCWVRVNAYGEGLVNMCRSRLQKGAYVVVDGELMNREGKLGDLTEVRAREIVVT